MEQSERKGFGSVVSVLPGRVIVLQALPGTPSAKSGLSPGDEILAINNVPLAQLVVRAVDRISGRGAAAAGAADGAAAGQRAADAVHAEAGTGGFAQRGPRVSVAAGHRLYPRGEFRSADGQAGEGRDRETGRRKI